MVGCQKQDRDDLAIHWKKQSYQSWLLQQRPYLAALPKAAIVDYDFTTLHSGTKVSPVVTYDLEAGKWDGIVELWFTLRLNTNGLAVGFSEETAIFISLPARKSVVGEGGKQRNQYYGVKIQKPSELANVISRITAGGDFSDFRKRVAESGEFECSFFDYNDPWKKHTGN